MHQRLTKSVGEAGVRARNARCPRPDGRDEMRRRRGRCGDRLDDRALDRADVGDDGAGLAGAGAMLAATSPQAPTGTQRMTRSAPRTASAAIVRDLVGEAERAHRARAPRASVARRRSRARPGRCARDPRRATSRSGRCRRWPAVEERLAQAAPSSSGTRGLQEIGQRLDDEPVGFLRADRQAQGAAAGHRRRRRAG